MRMLALAASLLLASTASASFFEDFEGGIPGTWTLTDYAGNGGWNVNTYFGDDNWTSGGGICADINSDYYGSVDIDAALISPLIAIPAGAMLEFDTNYITYLGYDYADTDISVDGGATWINLLSWHGDADEQGTFWGEGVHISVDLFDYSGQDAMFRFHYYDANWEWYWQVDNFAVTPAPGALALLGLAGLIGRRRR